MRRWLLGTAVALAISFPLVAITQIIAVASDRSDGIGIVGDAILLTLIFVGPVIGGVTVGRPHLDPPPVLAGGTALGLVAIFTTVLRAIDGSETNVVVVPLLAVFGASLGWVGWAIHAGWSAARTRS